MCLYKQVTKGHHRLLKKNESNQNIKEKKLKWIKSISKFLNKFPPNEHKKCSRIFNENYGKPDLNESFLPIESITVIKMVIWNSSNGIPNSIFEYHDKNES